MVEIGGCRMFQMGANVVVEKGHKLGRTLDIVRNEVVEFLIKYSKYPTSRSCGQPLNPGRTGKGDSNTKREKRFALEKK